MDRVHAGLQAGEHVESAIARVCRGNRAGVRRTIAACVEQHPDTIHALTGIIVPVAVLIEEHHVAHAHGRSHTRRSAETEVDGHVAILVTSQVCCALESCFRAARTGEGFPAVGERKLNGADAGDIGVRSVQRVFVDVVIRSVVRAEARCRGMSGKRFPRRKL